jgi:hypothetical protein
MSKREAILAAFIGIGVLGICGGKIVDRLDVSAAYAACSSQGETFSKMQAALAPHGVLFTQLAGGRAQVGYRARWSTRWLCELSVADSGRIVASRLLRH